LKEACELKAMLTVKPELQHAKREELVDRRIEQLKEILKDIFKQLPKERRSQAYIDFSNEKNNKS
jgi:Zn-dependent M16 (insulinase) family peptidase